MKKTTIGLVGAGGVGRIHIQNIIKNIPAANLKYIADAYPEKYNSWASQTDYPKAIEDYKVILNDPEIEAVVISVPAALHADMIIEAAEHGKHIFCEKPFDYDLNKIIDAMAAVKKAGVKLQIGFNRRFDKNFARAKEHINTGNIGDIHVIRITSRDPVPPGLEYFTAEGGEHTSIFTDTTIHDFDMARFFNKSKVVEVFARGSQLINKKHPIIKKADTMAAILKFEDESLAIIDNSWQAVYGYDQRAEIFGNKGSVVINNDVYNNAVLYTDKGEIGELPLVTWEDRYGVSYANEIKEFIGSIQQDTPVKVTGEDGLMAMVIANAAALSAEENRAVMISEMMPK